ncbi:solute carrier family 35 member F1-like protein [Tanacetum coccineum]
MTTNWRKRYCRYQIQQRAQNGVPYSVLVRNHERKKDDDVSDKIVIYAQSVLASDLSLESEHAELGTGDSLGLHYAGHRAIFLDDRATGQRLHNDHQEFRGGGRARSMRKVAGHGALMVYQPTHDRQNTYIIVENHSGERKQRPRCSIEMQLLTWFFEQFPVPSEEYVVKKVGRVEVLAMFGAFGMLVSIMEMYPLSLKGRSIFERKSLAVAPWNQAVILTFVGFGIAGFMFCSLTPLVLEASGATLFNLSLLTADMWAVVIRVLIYHQKVDWLYYVSFLFVGIGLIIYSKTEKYPSEVSKLENADTERQYKLLPEEAVRE